MSVKWKKIALPLIPGLLFLVTALSFDRDTLDFMMERLVKLFAHQEKLAVAQTLKVYNAIFSDFYASNGVPAMLNRFPAVKGVRHEVFKDIGFLRESNRILVYNVAGLTPMEIKFSQPDQAEVVLFEEWNYIYQNLKTRIPITSIKGMGQGFKYTLKRQDGDWTVVAWEPVDIKEPKKKDGFYF